MDFLRLIEARLARWLAYADSCVNAETELARCQGFWSFVAVALGVVCAMAIAGVAVTMIQASRKRRPPGVKGRYGKS